MSACAVYLWGYAFAQRNSHILFFNKELRDSQNNLKRLKDLMDALPEWLRDGVLSDPINDRNAIEYVYSAHRKNRIDPKPGATSLEHADLLGRGNTVPQIWYDELAFMKFSREIYMAAVPAQSEARSSAMKMGVPYGTVVTTTPNSQDTAAGEFAYMLRGGSLQFRLEFYDFGPTRVREMIDEEAEYNFLYAEYQYHEIGRDEVWFREQCRELLNDQMKIKRELLLVWPMSTEGAIFSEEQLDRLRQYRGEVVATLPIRPRTGHVPPGLALEFTEVPDPAVPYVLSVDTSSGLGIDYTAFVMSHPDDMRTIGSARTNTADDQAICVATATIMVDLFPKAIAVVERNHLGIVVVNSLLRITGMESRVFYLDKEREAERTVGKLVVKKKRKVRVYGVDTTVESREAMLRHLFQIVDETPHLLRCASIQDEIRTLHRKKTGKIEHRPGFHDDRLMAWLIAVYAHRHDNPVLRALIGRQRSDGKTITAISEMNLAPGQAKPPVPVLTVEDYTGEPDADREKDVRRKRMSALLSSLNGGEDIPT